MADEREDTKPEGTENEDPSTEEEVDPNEEDTTAEEEAAQIEGGQSDTVARSELVKAIKRRQAATKKARELTQELEALRRQNETESEAKIREETDKTRKALEGKYKPALIKTAAEAALLAANPRNGKAGIPRLVKLMDLDSIEINDDLELEGVEEEVLRLTEEFPELFGAESVEKPAEEEKKETPRRRSTSRAQDGSDKKPAPPKKTTAEILMAKLRGDA